MTSNPMTRWRVAQTYTSPQRHTPLDGREPQWQAWSEDGRHLKRGFHSHAEAIAYADRMARTIKVELPPIENTYIIASVEDNMLVCATPLFNYRQGQQ